MKKKVLIITGIIIVILVTTGLVTSYIDSARVRNSVEPKYVIKIISEDGNKVIYWGLGYKVIRYPSVSPNEPYKNNIGVKYGSWFMKYELEEEKSTTSSKKIEVIKPEHYNAIKFSKYLERDDRTIYLAGNLEDVFYYTDSNNKITLKEHITKSYKTIDDSIKELTDLMTYTGTLKDGKAKIYKSKSYDITIIKCNTIAGNKNIFIGDYSMEFNNKSMCK